MLRHDNWFSSADVLRLFLICLITTVFTRNIAESEKEYFEASLRSLSLPIPGDISSHRCYQEVPTVLTLESPHQRIMGNGTNSYWTRYQACCEGYKRYEHDWNVCVPDCGNKCENGLCVAPDECHCFPGHVKSDDGECVTTCPLGCLNGKCSYDGRCSCNPGYELDPYGKFCRPTCRNRCNYNENCTFPNHCECSKGYSRHDGNCYPNCDPNCEFGKCVGPNQCNCYPGYKLRNGVCQVLCNLVCENGFCSDYYQCTCRLGYIYDSHATTCIPHCTGCENGTCIEPNVCRCHKGYVLVNGECKPHCLRGCYGGTCTEPNRCQCEYGRVDKVGYCRKFGERRCTAAVNGYCVRWSEFFSWSDQK